MDLFYASYSLCNIFHITMCQPQSQPLLCLSILPPIVRENDSQVLALNPEWMFFFPLIHVSLSLVYPSGGGEEWN